MHHETADPDDHWPTCTACARQLRADEAGRVACRLCQQRTDHDLQELAGPNGLYATLQHVLTPSATGPGAPGASTRIHAPLPLRLEPLSLTARGGVVTILQTWLADWHDHLSWTHPRWEGNLQAQLDQAVRALRNNLAWAATEHPAYAEFGTEIASIVRQCRRQVTGERPERRIAVACPCGSNLRITISTTGARCAGCDTQYDRDGILSLPLAARTGTAA